MAYLISVDSSRKSTAEAIKKIYREKDISLKEYSFEGKIYLVSYVDPSKVLPANVLADKNVKISRINSEDLKKLATINVKRVLESIKPVEGKRVKIVKGQYQGFQGIILKELANGKYQVVVSVLGMSVPVEVEKDEIEVI